MSRFSAIYAAFLITLLASVVASATTRPTKATPAPKSRADKLNQFVVSAGQALRSMALGIQRLGKFHKPIKSKLQRYLNPSLNFLKSLESVCRDGWIKYEASCFLFVRCHGECSSNQAMKSCMKNQASLAKASSASDTAFFTSMLQRRGRIFLGGNDRDNDGTWRWPDGSLIEDGYTNWDKNCRSPGQTEKCMFYFPAKGKWCHIMCGRKLRFYTAYVCETSPTFL